MNKKIEICIEVNPSTNTSELIYKSDNVALNELIEYVGAIIARQTQKKPEIQKIDELKMFIAHAQNILEKSFYSNLKIINREILND